MRGLGLIVYGDMGIGKTSFALQFPGPLKCISVRESGFADLFDMGQVPEGSTNCIVTTFQEFIEELNDVDDYRTVVVDSLSGVWQAAKDDIINQVYASKDNPLDAFGSFSEGARIHGPIWMEKVETFAERVRNKGINIVLIGHTKIEKAKNIISTDYQSAHINMESWPRDVLKKWAQAVLFMTLDFDLKITKKWQGVPTEAKASTSLEEEVSRIIYTTKHPSHDAKNRLGLPPFILMGENANETYLRFVKCLTPNFQEHLSASDN